MMVGPTIEEICPMEGPMKVRPEPVHTCVAVPAVAPWPCCPVEVPHGPARLERVPAAADTALNPGVV
jgi:hypothetical protein